MLRFCEESKEEEELDPTSEEAQRNIMGRVFLAPEFGFTKN